MSKMHVVSLADAMKLDELAREISPMLFWTCNYEPTESYSINEDAIYQDCIQDLYKFAIDTNCVLRPLVYSPKYSIYDGLLSRDERTRMRSSIDTIQMLRSVIDHNQSESNGRYSVMSLDSYRKWIKNQLGNDRPASNEDFEVLCNALKILGNALISDCELILRRLISLNNRQEFVDRWINSTIRWYTTGARQQYYKGQLADYYIARALQTRPHFLDQTPQWQVTAKVNSWIRAQVTYEYERLVGEKKSIQEHIKHPTAIELKVKSSRPEIFDEMQAQRRQDMEAISAKLRSIEADFDRLKAVYKDNKCSWFFDAQRLGNQLHATIKNLLSNGEPFTLLPQSLLQMDVSYNFRKVPSPDNDF